MKKNKNRVPRSPAEFMLQIFFLGGYKICPNNDTGEWPVGFGAILKKGQRVLNM